VRILVHDKEAPGLLCSSGQRCSTVTWLSRLDWLTCERTDTTRPPAPCPCFSFFLGSSRFAKPISPHQNNPLPANIPSKTTSSKPCSSAKSGKDPLGKSPVPWTTAARPFLAVRVGTTGTNWRSYKIPLPGCANLPQPTPRSGTAAHNTTYNRSHVRSAC
jgi:hypothetical protein